MANLFTRLLLPLVVFLFLAYTAFRICIQESITETGLDVRVPAICNAPFGSHPYRLAYFGIPAIDNLLCGLVVAFQTLIDSAYYPLLAVLLPTVAVVALIPYLETARDQPSLVLRLPTAVGLLFQLFSMAVVMPIYALLFVITGTAFMPPSPTSYPPSRISQANAEALLFGFILGYVLPTVAMVVFADPTVTAIWQPFPLIFAFGIIAYKVVCPPSRHNKSGHATVVATLGATFLASALLHAVYVWPILTDMDALRVQLIPEMGILDPEVMSLADGVAYFIKWDEVIGAITIIVTTLWMADGMSTFVGILAWYGVAIVALGPGAAIAGVLLWRERRLNGRAHASTNRSKSQ